MEGFWLVDGPPSAFHFFSNKGAHCETFGALNPVGFDLSNSQVQSFSD